MAISQPELSWTRVYSDGLGRLFEVIENNGNSTTYNYDTLGNLAAVGQGSQTRTFSYSSLGRLVNAANPETGTIRYTEYDANGNLKSKTDALNVTTTMTYDSMNRLKTKSYSDGTPTVTYQYGDTSSCYAIGRLLSVSSSVSSSSYCYDAQGRVKANTQTTGGTPYTFNYTYYASGALKSMSYPSLRTINYAVDDLSRVTSISGTNAGVTTQYAGGTTSPIQYWPHGAVSQMKRGDQITETAGYNSRLEMTSLAAGSALSLGLYYCPNGASTCTSNNGNVLRETINAGGTLYTQDYTYDSVNRLRTMTEGSQFQQYVYDRYGNRALLDTSYNPEGSSTPAVSSDTEAAVEAIFPNNRWTGAVHDAAGNEKAVPGFQYSYDAENRLTSVTHPNFSTIAYAYDGEGRRVKKTVNTTTIVYVYDAAGQLAAEYGAPAVTGGTQYLTADHLGSTRMVTNASGAPTQRFDYLPFGGELRAGFNGRSADYSPATYPSTPLPTANLFTGQIRDAETGLDYFGARYFSGAQGRFSSPDVPLLDQHAINPQSWNIYTYARNNPLSYLDPTGNCSVKAGSSAATDDPGEPCVAPGNSSVTVTAKGGGPDEARIALFVLMMHDALTTQLRETRDIAISTYAGQALGFGIGKFVVAPAVNAVATRLAAQRALRRLRQK